MKYSQTELVPETPEKVDGAQFSDTENIKRKYPETKKKHDGFGEFEFLRHLLDGDLFGLAVGDEADAVKGAADVERVVIQ